jgi:hypothetical protein
MRGPRGLSRFEAGLLIVFVEMPHDSVSAGAESQQQL